jgi:hypothetical protein
MSTTAIFAREEFKTTRVPTVADAACAFTIIADAVT